MFILGGHSEGEVGSGDGVGGGDARHQGALGHLYNSVNEHPSVGSREKAGGGRGHGESGGGRGCGPGGK